MDHPEHGGSPDAHHGPDVGAYMKIFIALSVFTAVSFLFYYALPPSLSFLFILAVAVIKATLVGMFFMHLKWDWGRLYFMIIPAFILATMMIIVLLPDIVLAWRS